MKKVLLWILVVVVVVLAWPSWLAYQVWDETKHEHLRKADAIVVLGAAQYDGKPSPVFQARLDHAADLYKRGFSPVVIVTGGKQQGDRFSEAEAGAEYLSTKDVPFGNILQESRGRTTLESMVKVKKIADDQGIETVLVVSDPLHTERVTRMAKDLGFRHAYTSWASYAELHRSRATKLKELMHEVASLMAYEVLDH
jgi:uncharacterized SAM-binding protein YcdF (DUF218 family)